MKSPLHQSIGRDVGGDWPWSIQSHALSILFSCKMWWVGKCNPQGGYNWQIELQYPVFWFKITVNNTSAQIAQLSLLSMVPFIEATRWTTHPMGKAGLEGLLRFHWLRRHCFATACWFGEPPGKVVPPVCFLGDWHAKHVLSCIQRGHPVHNRQSAVMTLNQNGGAVLKHSAQHLAIKEWDTMWIKPYHLWILMVDWKINWETNQGQMSTESPPPPWSNDRMAWCFAIECCMAIKIKLGAPQVLAIWTIKNTWWVNRGFILVGFLEIIITYYNP